MPLSQSNSSGVSIPHGRKCVDHGYGVAVDVRWYAYTGKPGSKNFPIASAIYGSNSDWMPCHKANTSGSPHFTYLGGNGGTGYGIAVDLRNAYINGKLSQLIFLHLLLMEAMVEDRCLYQR